MNQSRKFVACQTCSFKFEPHQSRFAHVVECPACGTTEFDWHDPTDGSLGTASDRPVVTNVIVLSDDRRATEAVQRLLEVLGFEMTDRGTFAMGMRRTRRSNSSMPGKQVYALLREDLGVHCPTVVMLTTSQGSSTRSIEVFDVYGVETYSVESSASLPDLLPFERQMPSASGRRSRLERMADGERDDKLSE